MNATFCNAQEAKEAAAELLRQSVSSDTPAVAAAVVVGGSLVFSGAAGTDDNGEMCSAERTIFMTASISKTITALACLQASERNELDLDADVGEYARIGARNPHFEDAKLTIRHLLQHRSGLCDDESALLEGEWRTEKADCEVALAEYVRARLVPGGASFDRRLWSRGKPPGEATYHYSNAGFALAGCVLEAATGKSLALLAKERIFEPLGMACSSFTLVEARLAPGVLASPTPPGHPYGVAEYPAAALRSTASDLAKYLLALTAPAGECPLLRASSLRELLPESFTGGLAWWGRDAMYGVRSQSAAVWTHGGFMEGVRTHVHLWPAKRAATVVLTNGEDEDGKNAIAGALREVVDAETAASVAGVSE